MMLASAQFLDNTVPCLSNVNKKLQCTAQDIRIARVFNITILDDGCAFPGDSVDFIATFEIASNAAERYDLGLWISVDGDLDMTGARTGICDVSTLPTSGTGFVNRDGDACGDIVAGRPVFYSMRVNTTCVSRFNDGRLALPTCVTWENNKRVVCNGLSSIHPGTPSKCACDNSLSIDIFVPPAIIASMDKVALTTSVTVPGASVDFMVTINADVNSAPFTIPAWSDPCFDGVTATTLATACGDNAPICRASTGLSCEIGGTAVVSAVFGVGSLSGVSLAAGSSLVCTYSAFVCGTAGAFENAFRVTMRDAAGETFNLNATAIVQFQGGP